MGYREDASSPWRARRHHGTSRAWGARSGRRRASSTLATLTLLLIGFAWGVAQSAAGHTDEEAIADALSAGPDAITEHATVLAWPTEEGGDFRVLREGNNGWWCIASTPGAAEVGLQDPSCDDETWLEFERAFLEGRDPAIDRVGIAYMLSGDAGLSNTDPFATEPTDDNEWHVSGPHIMVVVPDAAMLDGFPTDPQSGGPYVMFAGTPYAHIMVPVTIEPLVRGDATPPADAEKITDALRAAPPAIGAGATVMDWPAGEGEAFRVLKEGDETWVCMATSTSAWQGGMRKAFCDDEVWQAWGAAFEAGETPVVERVGISYSLSFDAEGSNTDPAAREPADDNDWHDIGPHVAVLVPDPSLYEGFSTDPHSGGPYVMYPGTAYAHIMVPIAPRN
jgi:hypothetical protein